MDCMTVVGWEHNAFATLRRHQKIMKTWVAIPLLLIAHAAGGVESATGTVRVAAIQCPSVMGKTQDNVRNLTNLVRQAAARGARIVVLPECAVQGYLDPTDWTAWSLSDSAAMAVSKVAEPVPGPSTTLFARLAGELNIYLCVGLIEAASNGFFNAQVLLSPTGTIVAHHRKQALWTPGDSTWCTPGDLPVQVVKTEFGNLGLMICFDFHALPPLLAKKGADIVLYSVGWYGPNEADWFGRVFPAKAVIPYGFHVIAANWSSRSPDRVWPGRGYSCIIKADGAILGMAITVVGNEIVMGDIPIGRHHY